MSYRKAWLLVEEMNRMFAKPLVAARPGGAKGGGAELTAAGAQVVALYRAAERKMRMGAKAEIARMERALAEIDCVRDHGRPGRTARCMTGVLTNALCRARRPRSQAF
jgi:molybdate transport system regulatory protein